MTFTKNQPPKIITAEAEVVVEAHEVTSADASFASPATSINQQASSIPTATPIHATPVNATTTIPTSHYNSRKMRKAERKYQRRARKCQVLERTPGGRVGFVLLSVPLSMVGAVRPKTTERLVTNHVKRDIHDVSTCGV